MARELPSYRSELEMVSAAFPDKALLSRADVGTYLKRGRYWLQSHGFDRREYTKSELAYRLASARDLGRWQA